MKKLPAQQLPFPFGEFLVVLALAIFVAFSGAPAIAILAFGLWFLAVALSK
jgi:hypothetical protein